MTMTLAHSLLAEDVLSAVLVHLPDDASSHRLWGIVHAVSSALNRAALMNRTRLDLTSHSSIDNLSHTIARYQRLECLTLSDCGWVDVASILPVLPCTLHFLHLDGCQQVSKSLRQRTMTHINEYIPKCRATFDWCWRASSPHPEFMMEFVRDHEGGFVLQAACVIATQLLALRDNDRHPDFEKNDGIEKTFEFASPANKQQTGPLSRFTQMITRGYSVMLNFENAIITTLTAASEGISITFQVQLENAMDAAQFVWQVSRQSCGSYMTDMVSALPLGVDLPPPFGTPLLQLKIGATGMPTAVF